MKARQNLLTGTIIVVALVTLVPMITTLPLLSVGFTVLAAIILTCFLFPQAMVNKETFLFLLYALYFIGSLYFKDFLVRIHVVKTVYWAVAVCFANALLYSRNELAMKIIAWACLGMIVLTCIFTSQQILYDSSIVRAGGVVDADIGESPLLVAGYAFAHGIPMLLPFFVFWVKKSDIRSKVIWILVLGVVTFFIVKANFGAAMIISLLMIPLSFMVTNNKNVNIILLVTFMLVAACFLNKTIVVFSLEAIEPFFEETAMASKISDIKGSIIAPGVEGQLYERGELYRGSWQAFLGSPLFGVAHSSDAFIGGHSFVLDTLAIGGVFGFIPLILFFWGMCKRVLVFIDKNKRIYFLLAIAIFIGLNAVKANVGGGGLFILIVVVPALSFAHYKRKKAKSPLNERSVWIS